MSKIDDYNKELCEITIDCLKAFASVVAAKHNIEKDEMNEAFAAACSTLSTSLLTRFLGFVKPEFRKMIVKRIITQVEENVQRYDKNEVP